MNTLRPEARVDDSGSNDTSLKRRTKKQRTHSDLVDRRREVRQGKQSKELLSTTMSRQCDNFSDGKIDDMPVLRNTSEGYIDDAVMSDLLTTVEKLQSKKNDASSTKTAKFESIANGKQITVANVGMYETKKRNNQLVTGCGGDGDGDVCTITKSAKKMHTGTKRMVGFSWKTGPSPTDKMQKPGDVRQRYLSDLLRVHKEIYGDGRVGDVPYHEVSFSDIIKDMHGRYERKLPELASELALSRLYDAIKVNRDKSIVNLREFSDDWRSIVAFLLEPVLRSMGDKMTPLIEAYKLLVSDVTSSVDVSNGDKCTETLMQRDGRIRCDDASVSSVNDAWVYRRSDTTDDPPAIRRDNKKTWKQYLGRTSNPFSTLQTILIHVMTHDVEINNINALVRQCYMCKKQTKCAYSIEKPREGGQRGDKQIGTKTTTHGNHFFGKECRVDKFGGSCGIKMVKLVQLMKCIRRVNMRDGARDKIYNIDGNKVSVGDAKKKTFVNDMLKILYSFV